MNQRKRVPLYVAGTILVVLAAAVLWRVNGGASRPVPRPGGTPGATAPEEVTDPIVILTGKEPGAAQTRKDLVFAWNEAHPDLPVRLKEIDGGADAQRAEMRTDSHVDIVNLDAPEVASFANEGLIRELPAAAVDRAGFLQRPLATCFWEGRYWALPFNTDVGLLLYRPGDPPPSGWDDLIRRSVSTGGAVYGGQFGRNEAFVVNVLEQVLTVDPTLLNEDGSPPKQIRRADWDAALTPLRNAYAAGVIRPSSTEDESTAEFAAGRVSVVRNWPAQVGTLSPRPLVRPLFGPAVLGGQNLAISRHTRYPRAALEVIRFLTDERSERKVLGDGTFAATRRAAYFQPDEPDPIPAHAADMLNAIESAVPRPITPGYHNVATVLIDYLQPAVVHNQPIADGFERALWGAFGSVPTRAFPSPT